MRQCKNCTHCESMGRAQAQGRNYVGRKHYYCKHENSYKCHEEYNRDRSNFIGYGDNTRESPLQVKTKPKWCPLSKEES